jgi:hypothetical protein
MNVAAERSLQLIRWLTPAAIVLAGMTVGATRTHQNVPPTRETAPAFPSAPFRPHTVALGLRGGYRVLATDMNRDGRIDLIGLGAQMNELLWYENPAWTPHVIVRGAARMIDVAAADIDRDGVPELALAYEYRSVPADSLGKVAILKAGPDPRAPWTLTDIDTLPTSHRLRFVRIGGQPHLVNAPLVGVTSRGPSDPERTPTPLRAYRPPAWRPQSITDANLGVVHGLFVGDWNGDGRDDVLTAGYLGVHAHSLTRDGQWGRTEIVKGNPVEWPQSGASDVAVGRMNRKRFFVTTEPFHGNQVVVYLDAPDDRWSRHVIDAELLNAHALVLLDSDVDGNHEIVAGGTRTARDAAPGRKPGVFFYKATNPSGLTWSKALLDPDIAANSCVAADIDGDQRNDVACIGNTDPWPLRWYENTRP